jgi:hypothetical protein
MAQQDESELRAAKADILLDFNVEGCSFLSKAAQLIETYQIQCPSCTVTFKV